jgi:hypothetical protein
MALIEIDGLPGFTGLENGGSFHGDLLVITRWYRAHFPLPISQIPCEKSELTF